MAFRDATQQTITKEKHHGSIQMRKMRRHQGRTLQTQKMPGLRRGRLHAEAGGKETGRRLRLLLQKINDL